MTFFVFFEKVQIVTKKSVHFWGYSIYTSTTGGAERLKNPLPQLDEGGSGGANAPPGVAGVWGRMPPALRGGPGGRDAPPASIYA